MTKEEAIKILKSKMDGSVDTSYEWAEAVRMAIEALQKEMPKNPVINFVADSDGVRRLNEGWTEDSLLCPVCHTYVGEVFDELYCSQCGQKIVQKRVKVIE